MRAKTARAANAYDFAGGMCLSTPSVEARSTSRTPTTRKLQASCADDLEPKFMIILLLRKARKERRREGRTARQRFLFSKSPDHMHPKERTYIFKDSPLQRGTLHESSRLRGELNSDTSSLLLPLARRITSAVIGAVEAEPQPATPDQLRASGRTGAREM